MNLSPSKSPVAPRSLGEPIESELQLVKGLFGSDLRRNEALEAIYREPDRAGPHTARCLAILIQGSSLDVSERRLAVQSLARIAAGADEMAVLLNRSEVVALDSNAFVSAFLKQIQRGEDAGWTALERLLCSSKVSDSQADSSLSILVQNVSYMQSPTPRLVPLLDSVLTARGGSIMGPALKSQLVNLIHVTSNEKIAALLLKHSSAPADLVSELLSSATGLAWASTMRLLALQAPLPDQRRTATNRYSVDCARERIENVESFVEEIRTLKPALLERSVAERIFTRYSQSDNRVSDRQYDQLQTMVTAGLLDPLSVMACLYKNEATDDGRRLVELSAGCRDESLTRAAQMLLLYISSFSLPVLTELLNPETTRGLPTEIKASLLRILGLRTERTPEGVRLLRATLIPYKLSADPLIKAAVRRAESLVSRNPIRRWIGQYQSMRDARLIFELLLVDGVQLTQQSARDLKDASKRLGSIHRF